METEFLYNKRTEEVADIIEKMPARFGLKVSVIVLLLVVLLGLFGWFIRYPDVVKGQITINGRQAPVKLVSTNTGNISLFISDSAVNVKAGKYIAMIKNSANPDHVIYLDSLLKETDLGHLSYIKHRHFFPEKLSIGELSNNYFNFLTALYQYLDYQHEKPFDKEKEITEKLVATQNQIKLKLLDDYSLQEKIYSNVKSLYRKDSSLSFQGLMSKADFEKSDIQKLLKEQELNAIQKQITNTDYQISDATYNLKFLDVKKNEKEREVLLNMMNAYYTLIDNIRFWEKKYVFISPVDGKIEFLTFLKNEDFVQTGQELFKIVPGQNEIVGELYLPEQGSGKVLEGQEVIIKLDNYPYQQFGAVKGKVKSISLVTNQQVLSNNQSKISSYLIMVNLPDGLKTNYGSLLNFHFEAKGIAEIITDRRRLIERLFDNLKYRLK